MSKIIVGHDKQSTHDVSLNADGSLWGLTLDGGPKGLAEGASVASSILANRQGAKFGDNDPTFSHIEQRTWLGGRGQENLSEDPSRFFDSRDMWTLSPNVLLPALQWKYAAGAGVRGAGKVYSQLPGNVKWTPLVGATLYLARTFTTTAAMSARELYLWAKKVGNPPGDLVAGVYPDASGTPNLAAPVKDKTITAASITDVVSFFARFLFDAAGSLDTATPYWIIVYSSGTPNAKNHWEIGYDADNKAGVTSPDGSAWTANANLGIYYRLTEADIKRTLLPFVMNGVHYFVTNNWKARASDVYMVGDRGKVAAGATTTSLTCTGKSWTADAWIGARVRIISGPGRHETAEITDNDGTTLTYSPALETAPTADSHFCIYDTPYLTQVSGTFGNVVSVAVANNIAFFARGTEAADLVILAFQYKTSDGTHETDADAAAKAEVLAVHMEDGTPKLYRFTSYANVSSSSIPAWTNNLSFGSDIKCGDSTWEVTNLISFNGALHVLKENEIGYISNGKYIPLNGANISCLAQNTNGLAAAVMDTYLWFGWSHSAERLAGGTLDDEGPWAGAGMPENRNGVFKWFEPVVAHMLGAMDAGTAGYSSVMAYNGFGNWTEILRGHNIGKRIRMIHWQENPEGRPTLWIEIGGDLIYQKFPKNTLNPLRDSGCTFMHEGTLESSTIDLDVYALPKFFKALTANTENLGSYLGYRRLAVEYQMDEDVNTSTWIPVKEFAHSPEESEDLNQGNKRQMRWRIRLMTEIATSPVKVRAIVVSGYAKLPAKRVWTLRIKVSSLSRDALGAPNVSPSSLYKWLWKQSKEAGGVYMHTKWEDCDGVWVVVEPPGLMRSMVNTIQQWWSGVATLTLREA